MDELRYKQPTEWIIGDGFHAKRKEVKWTEPEEPGSLRVPVASTWGLYRDDKEIATRNVDYEQGDRLLSVMKMFEDEIQDHLGPGQTRWLFKMASENPDDIPPWDREGQCTSRTFSPVTHTFDDEGNANRFEDECRGWLIFDTRSKKWFAWQGTHWAEAEERVSLAARVVGRSVAYEEKKWEEAYDGQVKSGFRSHKKRSANLRAQEAMVKMAAAMMTVDLESESDPSLVACDNGIIDCQSGEFYPLWKCDELRSRYPTHHVADGISYTPGAAPEHFLSHLTKVMEDNTTTDLDDDERRLRADQLVPVLLRIFGYALYPGNPERIFVFFWGEGRNGKSTTVEILQKIFGNESANPTLTQLYTVESDRPAPSIAKALPKRLAIFSEADGDAPISTSAFKEITGEKSTERFRAMHTNNVRISIHCLPIATTNNLPTFDRPVDRALFTRLITIPFRHRFPGEDRAIHELLSSERSKIFSLVVDELRKYLAVGLLSVPEYAMASQKELLAGSIYYDFFTDEIEPTNGKGPDERMLRSELKEYFLRWVRLEGRDDEISTRWERSEDGYGSEKTLTKKETERLFSAARILEYQEVKSNGQRRFKAKIRQSPQRRLQ
ncbi:MAG: hypothetical protein O0X96_06825 [Methanocorpusculum sp.]|nr:hypothetical protein [Methanocorpusculum sp.]